MPAQPDHPDGPADPTEGRTTDRTGRPALTSPLDPPAAGPAGAADAVAFATKPALVVFSWVLAAAAVAALVYTPQPPGRILAAVAAAGLAVFALFGTLARPRLAADATGVTVRRLGGQRHWSWPEVRITVTAARRLGRESHLLELEITRPDDADEDLVVLGWLDLGADPRDVATQLRATAAAHR